MIVRSRIPSAAHAIFLAVTATAILGLGLRVGAWLTQQDGLVVDAQAPTATHTFTPGPTMTPHDTPSTPLATSVATYFPPGITTSMKVTMTQHTTPRVTPLASPTP